MREGCLCGGGSEFEAAVGAHWFSSTPSTPWRQALHAAPRTIASGASESRSELRYELLSQIE